MLTDTSYIFDERLRGLLQVMTNKGAAHVAKGLSRMVGKALSVSQPEARLVPLAEVPYLLGGPESEAVGVYLLVQGELTGQLVLALTYPKALELANLAMHEPAGTARSLGRIERSALAEVGNLIGSFFLSVVESFTGFRARPTSPAVMVDMISAILDIVVATYGGVGESMLMLQVSFLSEDRLLEADFWIIPDPAALAAFAREKFRAEA